jgi:hypothetical protein
VALAAATVTLAGCGNLTAGGFGEARVTVSGDAPDPVLAPSVPVGGNAWAAPASGTSAGSSGGPALSDHDEIDPEGELRLKFRLYLRRVDGTEVSLSPDELQAEMDLSGEVEADVVRIRIPADSYPELRIVFKEIQVQVDRGVIIGGQEITGPVDVEIEDLEVIRALGLEVADNSIVDVLLDLNAATWLAAVDPELRTVRPEDFAAAFTVRVR